MSKKLYAALLIPALLLCACSKDKDETPEEKAEVDSLVEAWMADDAGETQPVTAADESVDGGATPLEQFEYTIREDGTAAILKYNGKDANVVITSHIGEAAVTEIGQYSFEAAWDVETLTLPETVNFIGEQAFLDCGSLVSINIPEGVTALHRATFAGCGSLTEIRLPASVAETQEELFSGCPLEQIYIENPALTYQSWGLEDLDPPCVIHAPAGSEMERWALENGFPTE